MNNSKGELDLIETLSQSTVALVEQAYIKSNERNITLRSTEKCQNAVSQGSEGQDDRQRRGQTPHSS